MLWLVVLGAVVLTGSAIVGLHRLILSNDKPVNLEACRVQAFQNQATNTVINDHSYTTARLYLAERELIEAALQNELYACEELYP